MKTQAQQGDWESKVAKPKLFNEPPAFTLPLSKGQDLYVNFAYKPCVVDGNGAPVLDSEGKKQYEIADFPVGSTVTMVIESDPEIEIEATIDGSLATVEHDYTDMDSVEAGVLWRVILTYADDRDKVICNGTIVRADGKR